MEKPDFEEMAATRGNVHLARYAYKAGMEAAAKIVESWPDGEMPAAEIRAATTNL